MLLYLLCYFGIEGLHERVGLIHYTKPSAQEPFKVVVPNLRALPSMFLMRNKIFNLSHRWAHQARHRHRGPGLAALRLSLQVLRLQNRVRQRGASLEVG